MTAGRGGLAERLAALVRVVPDWPTPGVSFKDATPLFADAAAFADSVDAIAAEFDRAGIDLVAGIEARGFILAAPVAVRLGVGFVPIRKHGKLAWTTVTADYELEYGSARIEVNNDAVTAGDRVLLIDDVLATGGTAAAALGLIDRLGGTAVAASFLIELPVLGGRARLGQVPVDRLLAL